MKLKQVLLNILLGTILLMVGCNSAEQKSESEADTSESVKESVVVETEIESTEWESETEKFIKTVEIQCYVINAADEHSLTEVKVTAVDGDEKEYEVKTDEDGWFELLLPEGTYTLTFEKENYEREELYDIVVESGKDVDIPDRIKLKSSLDSTYILPESDSRVYDISEIQELATEQLELARNEIFARHGRKFQREDLKAYFNGKSWYQESIEPEDFDDNTMLSEIEKANLDLIRGVEEGNIIDINNEYILDYTIKTEHFSHYTSTGVEVRYEEYTYPVFSGQYSEAINDFVNREWLQEKEGLSDTTDQDDEYQSYLELYGTDLYLPFFDKESISVVYSKNGYISMLNDWGFWGGGMHEYYYKSGAILQVSTGERVSYLEFLPMGVNIDDLIERYKTSIIFYQNDLNQNSDLAEQAEAYVITEAGLVFYYNVGAAVPREEVVIPWEELISNI